MFGNIKGFPTPTHSTGDKPKNPMIGGSTALMLKGIGINPEEVEKVAESLIEAINGLGQKLDSIDKRLTAIEKSLSVEPPDGEE